MDMNDAGRTEFVRKSKHVIHGSFPRSCGLFQVADHGVHETGDVASGDDAVVE
jgi:hypothetical protein